MMSFLTNTYYGNTVEQWLIAFGIILGGVIVGKILYWICGTVFKKLASKTKTKLDDIIVDMIEEPIVFAIILVAIYYAITTLTFSETAHKWIGDIYMILIVINVAWLITRMLDALVKQYVVPLTDKSETDLDDQLLPIMRKGIKIIIWCVAIIVALNNAGYNVAALLAGLGIGGLALAMAAKDTVANIFGGFTILTDKPFKLGDRVQVAGFDGTIEEIGLRSTRLRTLEGRLVTIPNMKFSDSPVENVSWEPSRKVVLDLGLTYDTKPEAMKKAQDILQDIAKKNASLEQDKTVTTFTNWNDSSMGIKFIYYIRKGEDIWQTLNDVNMAVLNEFNKAKLDFAFPTRTVYNVKG